MKDEAQKAKNRERAKARRLADPVAFNAKRRARYAQDGESARRSSNKRRLFLKELEAENPNDPRVIRNRESLRKGFKTFRLKHPNRVINHSPEAIEKRRLRRNLSCRIIHELQRGLAGKIKKTETTVQLLGCSIESFKLYVESRWEEGMSWKNYGKLDGWVLDHIIPVAIFDLTIKEHRERAFHYSNYQPLGHAANRKKWCKVPAGTDLSFLNK